jgi:hypothetical protein
MATTTPGVSTGNDFSITASMRLKIAVFAPMPNAIDKMAVAANPGLLRRSRPP